MAYVDGFLLPVPKRKVNAYLELSRKAGKIWREHGAVEYRECVGDDLNIKNMTGFPKMAKTKAGETVVFSWILWPSREVRNSAMKAVMADPRMQPGANPMPFDGKRVIFGGFEMIVEE